MATIYEILEREHGAVDHLLGELHDTDVAEAKRRTALVAQLVEELAALSRAEQEIVYPLLTREPDGNAEVRHALADHGAIETAMRDLVACEVHDEMWIAKLEVLRECVDHHIARDEGVAVALAASALPLYWMWQSRAVPQINDISTDVANPPRFEAILPLRANAPVPASYPGPATARMQRTGYPDVRTRVVPEPTDRMFAKALTVARDSGWTIVASDPTTGRIEATATSFWFGFKDDIVIRIVRAGNGSRIDIRSVSRVGKSDLGANANRIRSFMSRMAS